jgi:hypothetical protein
MTGDDGNSVGEYFRTRTSAEGFARTSAEGFEIAVE